MRIFHLVGRGTWATAVAAGEYRPPSLGTEGFVHFSFGGQVARTANTRFRDETDLVVVEVESALVPHELRIEDSYRSGVEFPHLYGPVPVAAASAVHALTRDDNGDWTFSPGDAAGPASRDH